MPWLPLTASIGFISVGFIAGWLIRSLGLKNRAESGLAAELLTAYAKSIDGHRDEAIRLLTLLTSQNSSSIDPFLTLGILFRRKGWLHRAVDVHRRLLQRSDLSDGMRGTILLEMARDFLECGLSDRAAEWAEKSFHFQQSEHDAARFLARLYERERSWEHAVTWWRCSAGELRKHCQIAFIRAIQAEECISRSDLKNAQKFLDVALEHDPDNPAALFENLHLAIVTSDAQRCVDECHKLLSVRPDLISCIVAQIRNWKIALPQSLDNYLIDWFSTFQLGHSPSLEFVDYLLSARRKDEATRVIEQIDLKQLAHERLAKYVDLAGKCNRSDLADLAIKTYFANSVSMDLYQCSDCGSLFGLLSWRCPQCESWGTLRNRNHISYSEQERKLP